MNRTRSALTAAAIAVVAVAGVTGAWLADWRLSPSNQDIRAAASELVPAGAVITDETAGPQGSFPDEGPYRALVEYTADGDRQRRAQAARAHAEQSGWSVADSGNLAGAAVLELEKGAVAARVSILDSGHTRISTGEGDISTAATLQHMAVVLVAGAAVVTAIWAAGRRARSDAPPQQGTYEASIAAPPPPPPNLS